MVSASDIFSFPLTTSELILDIDNVRIKNTYDKKYVVNVNEYMSREEVLYYGIKNYHLEMSGMSNRMFTGSKTLAFADDSLKSQIYLPPKPPIFGMFLGGVIPVYQGPKMLLSHKLEENEVQNSVNIEKDNLFETNMDWWIEILPAPALSKACKTEKPVWLFWPWSTK